MTRKPDVVESLLESTVVKLDSFGTRMASVEMRTNCTEIRTTNVESRMSNLESQIENWEKRVNSLQQTESSSITGIQTPAERTISPELIDDVRASGVKEKSSNIARSQDKEKHTQTKECNGNNAIDEIKVPREKAVERNKESIKRKSDSFGSDDDELNAVLSADEELEDPDVPAGAFGGSNCIVHPAVIKRPNFLFQEETL